jgi:hypothetical protein
MIRPWRVLNNGGRILAVACVINMWIAILLAHRGEWSSIFSVVMAAFCGMMTYNKRYQYKDADDINRS